MAPLVQYAPVTSTAVTVSAAVKAVACTYHGIVVRNTSSSAVATVRVYDDPNSADGTLLDTIQLAASESVGTWYERGKKAATGVYFSVVAGAVEGSVATSRTI